MFDHQVKVFFLHNHQAKLVIIYLFENIIYITRQSIFFYLDVHILYTMLVIQKCYCFIMI